MQEIGSSIQSVGNASFDRVEQPVAQTEEVDSTEETESGDTVEITITEIPPDESTPSGTAIGTYGPRAVGDRFKYDIQNGMLDGSLRFSALNKPFNISADATTDRLTAPAGRHRFRLYPPPMASRRATRRSYHGRGPIPPDGGPG